MMHPFLKNPVAILFLAAFLFFSGTDISSAAGFEISAGNYADRLATQGGVFSADGKNITLKSNGQSVLVVKTGDIHEVINTVDFSDLSYKSPSVVFIWKIRGQEYSPSNQMQFAVKNGLIHIPQSLILDNFDFIGFVFFEPSITFSTITLRQENFTDKLSVFMEPELVKPSSINLLYGAKFGSTPLVAILGILAVLVFGVLVFLNRKWAFASLLVFWLLFDLRYSYDQYSILKTTYTDFVAPNDSKQKIYYDFYNFYGFIEESKKYVHGDINFYAPREWPFQSNYTYHIYPLKNTWQTTDKPYYVIFQMDNIELKNGKELFMNGKLIDSNVHLLYQFDEHSYILKKN